ncbi:MAG: Porphobilinogen deaminase [Deltaproteobacteria bacterium ADurb.BinA179]|jgi:hydroxymethylbilane synthase|nr:hydroxymethylbilane synthase [Deltaproteobacteria bacterium]MDI9543701.1 hydroxymethylbilane synthase [Pseudomonadota bacterium]NLW66653.1 hydroxymethylbilane synthase [Bacteriovoracaceae bacterium]OPZ29426.1 MAG: Porphobilinogen deaminase [Deltaproteobacteria bacterium ADurb.BinA179]HRR20179.1 hydroxymethylbilane synthase [Desulfomonilia bacterium]
MRTIRIGTRGSALALKQTEMVRRALARFEPGITTKVHTIRTTGDIHADAPLDAIGGKGVFVKEIERKLLQGEIDCAVHSLKDMQAVVPQGLSIGAYLERDDPRDMLFSKGRHTLEDLPAGVRIGTSSMRRRCQIRLHRPDLVIVDIRGNVPTRLGKIGAEVSAVVLAAAGVRRLGLEEGVALDAWSMVPSPGQGIIAVEARSDDREVGDLLGRIDHGPSRICAEAEREFLAALGQDCNLPAGAYAVWDGEEISIVGMLGSPDETRVERMSMQGADPAVGRRLALALKEKVHPEEYP